MRYIFIINGRPDKAAFREEVERQLAQCSLEDYTMYVTTGVGDGTRHVRIWCDLHRDEPACFVACGASGMANEVASGIIGSPNKCMAIWAFGGTCDFTKYYPDRDFTSLKKLLAGEKKAIDVIRANDSYAINMACVGFSASVAAEANHYIEEGKNNPYRRGVLAALFTSRRNNIRVTADGKRLNRRHIFMADIANGHYSGGQYLTTPWAKNDDGLMDVVLVRPMTLIAFVLVLRHYKVGTHLTNRFCQRRVKYLQATHIDLTSPDLITLSLDGEIVASSSFSIDVLPGALNIILPRTEKE